jgi:class 3 adenylate cyclase
MFFAVTIYGFCAFAVYDNFSMNKSVVGMVAGTIYWQVYFRDILPDGSGSILAVLANSCNQSYTYEIDGSHVNYVGPGDLHDSGYNYLEICSNFTTFLVAEGQETNTEGNCEYKLCLYPTANFEDTETTEKPVIFTVALACVFIFTAAFFFLYDFLIEDRQRRVMSKATQAGSIVSSLFPAQVRDQLYAQAANDKKTHDDKERGNNASTVDKFLDTREKSGAKVNETSPIAFTFPECTVFFADIAGFTKWSANRPPSDVFVLLETLYGAFDEIAVRKGVFKVETIGDCYVAVTGLPEPQPDHAMIMVKFATLCREKLLCIVKDLADVLGPDTSNLTMRIGLHSGSVIAGVLRGQKSRFQLFGDTVNTASRMESTGMSSMIQCSEETAQILRACGKEGLLMPRKEIVSVKGKGNVQTYWVNSQGTTSSGKAPSSISADDIFSDGAISLDMSRLDPESTIHSQSSKFTATTSLASSSSYSPPLSAAPNSMDVWTTETIRKMHERAVVEHQLGELTEI